jgi:AcrR family transcriptional regulator
VAFSPVQERRQRQRDEVRRAILEAAEELLAEHGPEGFSMRRLAALCRYTPPTIYHHFGDKTGVLDAILEERFREVLAVVRAAPRRDDPVELVREQMRSFLDFFLRNPSHYQLLVDAMRVGAEPPSAQEVRDLLEGPLAALQRAGRLRAPDTEVARQALWAFIHGIISLRTSRADLPWAPDLLEVALDGMLLGLIRGEPERTQEKQP